MNFDLIVAVVAILYFVVGGFKRNKLGVLSCGQWGYIGDSYDPHKIGVLGLFNQTRGVHSCGIYVDSEISKGTGDDKLWMDFVVSKPLPKKLKSGNKVVMGHCRQASSGYGHTEDKQHPYLIGNKIGQQNGTLKNTHLLAQKYGIHANEWDVDTQLLYTIMDRHGYGVLEEYIGAAALMWVHADSPNELFVFRGASMDGPKKDMFYEERPLYYMKEGNGYYFSSMDNSLEFIKKSSAQVIERVPFNRIMKLFFDDDGKVQFTLVQYMNRDGSKFIQYNTWGNGSAPKQITGPNMNGDANTTHTNQNGNGGRNLSIPFNADAFKVKCINADKAVGETVRVQNGRFICMERYLNGIVRIDGDKVVKKGGEVYYFFAGVMFETQTEYNNFARDPWKYHPITNGSKMKHYFKRYAFFKFPTAPNWIIEISKWSKYPIKVTPTNTESTLYTEKWYFKGKEADGVVVYPEFSNKKIRYKHGWIVETSVNAGETPEQRVQEYAEPALKKNTQANIVASEVPDLDSIFADANSNCSNNSCGLPAVYSDIDLDESIVDLHFDIPFASLWDVVFESLERFLYEISLDQLVYLHRYVQCLCEDIPSNNLEISDEHVQLMIYQYVLQACSGKRSLRDMIQDNSLGTFEEFIDVNKDLDSADEFDRAKRKIRKLYQEDMLTAMNGNKVSLLKINKEEEDDTDEIVDLALADTNLIVQSLTDMSSDIEGMDDSESSKKLRNILDQAAADLKSKIEVFKKEIKETV